MGHEIAGEVAALGPHASGVKVGDKVVAYHGLGAGNVRYAGRARNCYASTRAPSAPDEPAAMEHT